MDAEIEMNQQDIEDRYTMIEGAKMIVDSDVCKALLNSLQHTYVRQWVESESQADREHLWRMVKVLRHFRDVLEQTAGGYMA